MASFGDQFISLWTIQSREKVSKYAVPRFQNCGGGRGRGTEGENGDRGRERENPSVAHAFCVTMQV